jgi:hypothetical protein
MKIGIIGSRRRDTDFDFQQVEKVFLSLYNKDDLDMNLEGCPDTLVSGGCSKGGDRFAEIIAKKYNIPITIYYANWNKYGKGAGFIRNTDIARESDVLIACVSQDRTGGTEDTIKKFLKNKDKRYLYLV